MSPPASLPALQAVLGAFESAARSASEAETILRRRLEAEILKLERQRAFAHRRLNFMNLLSRAVQSAENENDAVEMGRAVVRTELGWVTESETRTETLRQLSPVIRTTFDCLVSGATEPPASEVVAGLGEFESWYETRFERPFWALFEQHVEHMPLVER